MKDMCIWGMWEMVSGALGLYIKFNKMIYTSEETYLMYHLPSASLIALLSSLGHGGLSVLQLDFINSNTGKEKKKAGKGLVC